MSEVSTAQATNYPRGNITGIQASVEWTEYEGSQTTNWCHLVVSATTDVGEIELIRDLLGIYSGDERPVVSHWASCPGGQAFGPLVPRPDDVGEEPAGGSTQ